MKPEIKCSSVIITIGLLLMLVSLTSGCTAERNTARDGSVEVEQVQQEEQHVDLKLDLPTDALYIVVRTEDFNLIPGQISSSDLASTVVARQMFRSLALPTGKGEAEKDLASDWWSEADNQVWNVALNDGAVMHDGTRLTADYIAELWNPHLHGELDSPAAVALSNVEDVQVIDEHHLRFHLQRPDGQFPASVLTSAALMIGETDDVDDQENLIGSGAFRFFRYTSYGAAVLRPINEEQLQFSSLVFQPLSADIDLSEPEDWSEETDEMLRRADVIMYLHPDEVQSVQSNLYLRVISSPGFNVRGLVVNDRITPFNSVQLRKALFYALGSGDDIISSLDPGSDLRYISSTSTWLPSSHPLNDEMPLLGNAEPERAAEFFMDAGLTRNDEGYWEHERGQATVPLECNILLPKDSFAVSDLVAQEMTQRLENAGVRVVKDWVPWRQFLSRFFSKQYDIAFTGWGSWSAAPENFLAPWLYSQGVNTINEQDRLNVDQMLEYESTSEDVLRWLGEQYLFLPLYTTEVTVAVRRDLSSLSELLPVPRFHLIE